MRGPLEGIRVFDLTLIMVGPWTTMNLGALGADVIHVERPNIARASLGGVPPYINGTSVGFITWNMNKRQMFLDLKSEADLEVAYQLLATCDVFVDNMRPGVVDRLGLSYEKLSEINPRIVYCTICGWGTSGPMAERTAADPQIQSFTGFAANSGAEGGRPEVYRHLTQMDATTGNYATTAILMALLARERTGKGQRIDLTMLEAGTAIQSSRIGEYLATGEQPPLMGSGALTVVPSGAFQTEDGTYIGVQATTPQQWQGFCKVLGLDDFAQDERFRSIAGRVDAREEIDARVRQVLATKPARWWQLSLNKASVPCARIMRFEELMYHPQVRLNHYIEPAQTQDWGEVYATGLPWTFSRTPATVLPASDAGAQTGEILDGLESSKPVPSAS
ncbi:MAG TPA: CoA transferase [Dehalococcoidia bacterium]|nr:CoA transferase [Dehalococcoidia bacterium]